MTELSPISAHQQPTVPLLRRPRPPKTKLVKKKSSHTTASRSRAQTGASSSMREGQQQWGASYTDTNDSGSTFTIYPLYPRGPPFLPPGRILRGVCPSVLYNFEDEFELYPEDQAEFTLNDFQSDPPEAHYRIVPSGLQGAVVSRQNYLKLTSWFAANVPRQESLNTVNIAVDYEAPESRKPRHQIILDLRAMIQEAIEASIYPDLELGDSPPVSSVSLEAPRWPTPSPDDVIFQSSTSRYFCGQGRSMSPFDAAHQPLISPAEVAILESMVNGGSQLSLKAHFLPKLPDLTPLCSTLSHLNLSFNDLRVFPGEVLQLHQLVCLRMRNNPIKEIPSDIRRLKRLEIFCISFSLLTDLPPGLYELISLVDLDVSHNSLQWLSRDIAKLRNLRKLNIEGNQLVGLPSPALSLPLTHLLLSDNLMHPLLWHENTRNQPQALVELCCVVVSRCVGNTEDSRLPSETKQILQSSHGVCDCCGGLLFGVGLRVIRAVAPEVFGVKHLPLLFTVCSPSCRGKLKRRASSYWTGTTDNGGT